MSRLIAVLRNQYGGHWTVDIIHVGYIFNYRRRNILLSVIFYACDLSALLNEITVYVLQEELQILMIILFS